MSAPPLIVIFGAAVGPGGQASPALLRRIGYGLQASRDHPDAPILCSGGAPRPGPTEAAIMAEVLVGQGVAAARLILDAHSLNTAGNVAAAVLAVRSGGHPYVVACTDSYHLPRVRLLLALEGISSLRGPIPRGRGGAPFGNWIGMALREAAAIPHSLARRAARGRSGG